MRFVEYRVEDMVARPDDPFGGKGVSFQRGRHPVEIVGDVAA